MTETDEAELLGDPQSELNGVELTEDEIDTLLEGQDSSERIECSNLSEASCSSAADEVCHAPANDTVSENDNIASESNDSLLEDGESEQLQKTGNDIHQNDNDLEDDLTICENQNGEVADSTASVLLADNTVKPERTPEQNLNGEVPFLVHDLLNTDEDNDNMAGDDDVCILDLPKDSNHCNGKQLKRYEPSEDDDISITDVLNNGNTSKKQRLVDAEEPDDDVVVEEALPKTSQPNYRFNRIGHQMMRCVIEKFRRENPEVLLATYVNNEVQKCQSGLRGMGSKLNQMHKICINQVEQLNKTWKGKNEQLKTQIDLLTHLKKAPTQNNQIQKPVQPRKSLANQQFAIPVLNQNAYTPRRQKREPASEINSSMSNGQTSWAMPMDVKVFESGNINRTQPQVTDGLIDEVIPDRINIEIPLNPEPRKCYATSPFDSDKNFQLPLRNYPISMEKILSRGISNVQVVINTAYEDFIVSKKLHGQVRYAIPCGTQIEEGSVVRLYFWIESMHTSWTMSKDARVLESGFTKFTMAFNSKQSLFQGDRISLVAFLSVSKSIKFVSGQTTYNMRKPVIKCAIDME